MILAGANLALGQPSAFPLTVGASTAQSRGISKPLYTLQSRSSALIRKAILSIQVHAQTDRGDAVKDLRRDRRPYAREVLLQRLISARKL